MSAQLNCAVDGRPLYWKRRWERGFAALRQFRAREGNCCPSRRHVEGGFSLGQWVSVQRYRKDLLPAERKRRLDAIGFVWDWRDYLWEQNFAALLNFKRREGHCCVPTFHKEGELKLGWWVATQRRNKKEMSADRKARLNKIGFVWSVGFFGIAPRLLTDQVRRVQKFRPLCDINCNFPRLVSGQ
jgi:Helicase associated domain